MSEKKRFHFIAVGGIIMHTLAIDALQKGHQVSGSDDEIYEPSRSKLAEAGLLPLELGWYPEKITPELDAVIVGMHARKDNSELLKAQELGLKIYSYPEYIYQQCIHKHRIVIAGSHGKTTITAIIIHVLNENRRRFDYLIGASLDGFEQMVSLSKDAPLMIIEGDEYLSAPFDPTPKFLHYHHHIGLISGIAWDHINVYPTFDDYIEPFEQFADITPKAGILIYSNDDSLASVVGAKERADVQEIPYFMHDYEVRDGETYLVHKKSHYHVQLFGEHNMKNISGAKAVCMKIGITEEEFYKAIQTFKGASKRLEKMGENNNFIFFKDFAHSPSKLLATTTAVKEQFQHRHLIACLELHTFSSLNKEFLEQYKDTFNAADTALVYYNPHTIQQKKLIPILPEDIQEAFDHKNLLVFNDSESLKNYLLNQDWNHKNLLMMSSGNFDNLDLNTLSQTIMEKVEN